jgi:hypothetical protein
MLSAASLCSKETLHRLEMRKFPFEGTVLKMSELRGGDFERFQNVHGQKFGPIQNPDLSLGIKDSSMIIGTKRLSLACLNQNLGQNCTHAF